MKTTPLAEIKERFGSKEKLVKEIKSMFDKGDLFDNLLNPDKGIARVSNAKLLRLHRVGTEIRERFGDRTKLTDDLLRILKREKDEGFRARLEGWGLPRLWDYYKSVTEKKAG